MITATPTRTSTGYQLGNLHADKLPIRQALTLIFTALGFSETQTAQQMHCSVSNVKQAKKVLFYKLNANSSAEAVTKAFENAYLRFASILVAIFISLFAPVISDHNTIARLQRTRTSQQLRARNTARLRQGDGIYWVPETNELVWS